MSIVERIPIENFYYDPLRRNFIYRPSGQPWKPGGVNAALGTIEGMKATDWLRLFAVGR